MGQTLFKGAFLCFLVIFVAFGLAGIDRSCLDAADSAYLASADALARGQMPYRDFLAAHPPLLFALGAPLAALKAGVLPFRVFSFLLAAGIGLGSWRVALKVGGDSRIALLAGILTLLAPLGLFFSRLFLNDALVSLLALGAVLALLNGTRKRTVLAGVLCLLGTLAKLTFLPFAAAFLVHLLFKDRRQALLFAAIAGGGSLAAAAALQAAASGAYLDAIIGAQASKSMSLSNLTEGLERLWQMDWPLVVAAVPGIWVASRELAPTTAGRERLRLLLLWLGAALVPLLTLPASGHDINLFQPAEPALALFAAWGLVGLMKSRRVAALVAVAAFVLLAAPGWLERDLDFLRRSNAEDTAVIVTAVRDSSSECQAVLVGGCYAVEAGRPVMGEYLDPFLWEERYRKGDPEALATLNELQRQLEEEKAGPVALAPGSLTAAVLEPALNQRYREAYATGTGPPVTLWLPAIAEGGG